MIIYYYIIVWKFLCIALHLVKTHEEIRSVKLIDQLILREPSKFFQYLQSSKFPIEILLCSALSLH